jgi:predicted transcriptional regulator of viral defense system
MSDTGPPPPPRPDHQWLFELATEQAGYFTAEQAHACGFSRALLAYCTRSGRFRRLQRGLYRLRDFPPSAHEELMAAWLATGRESAVISHESALDLLGLSDVIPDAIHLTVPRTRRTAPRLPGTVLHTTIRPLQPDEIVVRAGMRVTAPARTILDAATTGTQPDQIERAVVEAIQRGLLAPEHLRAAARGRGGRVARLIDRALERARRVPA